MKAKEERKDVIMLSEGLKNVDNASVIIGIVEGEQPESLDVLLRVSEDGFSTSARAFLFDYCKIKFGWGETEDYLEKHARNQRLVWAREYFNVKKKWAYDPDDSARRLISAITDGSEADIREAVKAGGCIMTSDMIFYTIPFAGLSDEMLKFLFVNAMSLPVRCLTVFALCEEINKNRNSGLYDVLCNMSTILIDVLIKNEGV